MEFHAKRHRCWLVKNVHLPHANRDRLAPIEILKRSRGLNSQKWFISSVDRILEQLHGQYCIRRQNDLCCVAALQVAELQPCRRGRAGLLEMNQEACKPEACAQRIEERG